MLLVFKQAFPGIPSLPLRKNVDGRARLRRPTDELAGGLMVAVANARHQPAY
jgi:hypothetical protein